MFAVVSRENKEKIGEIVFEILELAIPEVRDMMENRLFRNVKRNGM